MKSFFSSVLNALLWAVMALLIFMVLSGVVQRYFGHSSNGLFGIGYAVVVSGSMEPNIHVDDMIIYHEHPADDYQVGDVIVYRRNAGTPEEIPDEYMKYALSEGVGRAAADYIAGMTDRYALGCFESLFVPKVWQYK